MEKEGIIDKLVGSNKVFTHWQWYRDLFHITVFRYLVVWFSIVPVFAKILYQLPKSIVFEPRKEQLIEVKLGLPFSWEYLWIASLLFVIAYFLYMAYCPRFIKTYSSFKDYKNLLHSPRWISWISRDIAKDKYELPKFFERLNKKGYLDQLNQKPETKNELPTVEVEGDQSILYFEFKDNFYKLGMPRLNNNSVDTEASSLAESEIFWEVFGRFSTSKKYVRLIILILLSISGVLFSIVLLQNIYNGLIYLIA